MAYKVNKSKSRNKNVKNILILALSTIPKSGELRRSGFCCDIKGVKIDNEEYFYTMEPVPRMLMQHLWKRNESLDEVIMICTEDVRKKLACIKDENGYSGKDVSAEDYFKYSLRRYIDNCEDGKLQSDDHPEFFHVSFSGRDNYSAETEIVGNIIAEVRKHPGAAIYIDTHGGFRTQQEVLNSVLSLLRSEGISIDPDNMFSVEYDPFLKHGEIVNAGLTIRILDFVSGMTEVTNYGRTASLEKYIGLSTADKDREIIDVTRSIALSMQLCDIAGFESGLDELGRKLSKRREGRGNTLLDIFIGTIKNNYKGLLDGKRTVIDEIKWSLNKGFYQQVLTLIESRIPKYLHEKGVFGYEDCVEQEAGSSRRDYEINNFLFNKVVGNIIKKNDRFGIFDNNVTPAAINSSNDVMIGNNNIVVNVCIRDDTAKEFLRWHMGLKEIRNLSSHASDRAYGSFDKNSFDSYIEKYLELVNKLERDDIKITKSESAV